MRLVCWLVIAVSMFVLPAAVMVGDVWATLFHASSGTLAALMLLRYWRSIT